MAQTQTASPLAAQYERTIFGPKDFVRTGPDTVMGRYLRSFWHPVYLGRELKAGRAIPLRIMNEDFTLYRGENGVAQILAPRCAHRCTQLSTGWVEGNALRCFYHGWKYDPTGQCIEAPAEREGFAATVQIRSYPTEEYLGLIFAYLGEGEAPPLPRFPDFEKDGVLSNSTYVRNCNFYNNLESNMDSLHSAFVHRTAPISLARGGALPDISGEETEYGILKHGITPDGIDRRSPFYWPNGLHIRSSPPQGDADVWEDHIGWRVPIDDENHRSLMVNHVAFTGEQAEQYRQRQEMRRKNRAELSSPHEAAKAVLRGDMHIDDFKGRPDLVNIQDYVAQVGQGVVPDFEHERLGRSDVLVALFRHILSRELQAMSEGRPLKQWKVTKSPGATTGTGSE